MNISILINEENKCVSGKAWPLLVGSGFGIGLAYGNCEKEISQALSVSASKKT